MAVVVACYLALLLIAIFARRIYPLGDDEARQLMEQVSEE